MTALKYSIFSLAVLLGQCVFANEVTIVDATAIKNGDTWTVAVTLNHPEEETKHRADLWRIVAEDGTVLGTRNLGHAHDQPFTRDLEGVVIPDHLTVVYIEAHEKVHGWAKERFTLKLNDGLKIGDAAPPFEATNQNGNPWKLNEHTGKYVVLYFYPAAMTGGCTKQACTYRDFISKNSMADIEIAGISGDSQESLNYFQKANNLNFSLLSDADGAIAKKYGVPVREGKKSLKRVLDGQEITLERTNTARRWTFIVNPEGKIIYRNMKVAPADDINNVIQFIQKRKEATS